MNEQGEQDWILLEDGITWSNEAQYLHAYVKWDGCTHLWFKADQGNVHPQGCYHHICDIDGFIQTMQSLRKKAAQKFDRDIEAMSHSERKGLIMPFHRDK